MKREIKFRRLYYYPDDGSSSWVIKQIMPDGNWREELPIGPFEEKSPWLQFTGLRDKNGKEIYEGDVVRYDFGAPRADHGPVDWSEGESRWMLRRMRSATVPLRSGLENHLEVIGNIHEHPHLIS